MSYPQKASRDGCCQKRSERVLAEAAFYTGDDETDRLLEVARRQVSSPHLDVRKDALEKLWDAFERIKTLEAGPDKRTQAEALLNKVAQAPQFRTALISEAKALTEIGNTFRIRHSETTQELIGQSDQIDYLFQRMFAFVRLVLKATNRAK